MTRRINLWRCFSAALAGVLLFTALPAMAETQHPSVTQGRGHQRQKSVFRKNGKLKKTVYVKSSVNKHGKIRKAHYRRQ